MVVFLGRLNIKFKFCDSQSISIMVNISSLKKAYGTNVLFTDVSFVINQGERVGLVGRNGHGKSTLMKIVLGQEEADGGAVHTPKEYRLGYLSQHLSFSEETILDEVCLALPLLDDCWKETYKAEAMLNGLGFSDGDFNRPPSSFSGGYQIRLNLAKLLLSEPELLLLDEPTNYLDIVSVRWLTGFLKSWDREVLLITHDRLFMDAVTTHTMGIHRGEIRKVEGGTAKYYQLLAEEEEIYEKTRMGDERKRAEMEVYINRFRAKASKAKSVQSRVKLLEKMEVKEGLSEIDNLSFSFKYAHSPSKWLLTVEDLAFGYEPGNLLFQGLSFSVGQGDRIAVVGANGRGKTTLLNVLSGEFEASEGSVSLSPNTESAYFGQTNISRLIPSRTVEEEVSVVDPTLGRTAVRSICGAMMFEGDSALKTVSVLSGGEKSRVLLGKILVQPSNLLFLDEPTNHLDMYSIDSLVDAINKFPGGVVIVTHSELLLSAIANRLVVFDSGKAEVFEGGYDDFLSQRGWSDEVSSAAEKVSTKTLPVAASDAAGAKKNTANTAQIEKNIVTREKKIEGLEKELLELGKGGSMSESDMRNASKLSTDVAKLRSEIEDLFGQLE